MNKLLEYGRKAMFLVRVLSGYEERRIRAYRLLLQEKIERAQAKKAELRRDPEKLILSEVRRMVEEMQSLNRRLEETEAAIDDYLKPIDKNVNMIVNMQLEKEEQQSKEMIRAMQEQALHHKEMATRQAELNSVDTSHQIQDAASSSLQQDKPTNVS